ncbi:MAG: YbjN domain-containing protein [Alphaproteobacteria bacterium]|nr:YbjN domain-containing protein [Alphaproteobacteria bacterium]
MIGAPFELAHDSNNPVDMVEELAETKGWEFVRHDDCTLDLSLPGQVANIGVSLEWQDEFSALLISCALPVKISAANYELAAVALEKINQNLWLGHFDLSHQDLLPTFRHTLLLRMIPTGIAIDLVADVLDIAVAECNRFHSTFRLAAAGDVRLHDDLSAAVFETVGEA